MIFKAFAFALLGLLTVAWLPAQAQSGSPAKKGPPLLMRDEAGGEEDEAARNRQWFYQQRAYPFGTIPPDARGRALADWKRVEASRPAANRRVTKGAPVPPAALAWRSIGPTPTSANISRITPVSGRVMALAVSPARADTVLAGTAGGGIWRSTDGGATWAPVSDDQADLSVGAVAFAPGDPDIVYAAMGEEYVSSGVLRSGDGGRTWTRVSDDSIPTPGLANDIAVDPRNPNRVYLALYAGLDDDGQLRAGGVFVSADGGRSWTKTLSGLPRDLAVDETNPEVLYVGMSRVDEGSDRSAGLWRSTDAGRTWTHFYHGPFDPDRNLDVSIAVSPAEPGRISVFLAGTVGSAPASRTAVTTNRGQSWTVFGTGDLERYGAEFLVADPVNAQRLVIGFGGSDLFRSLDGGQSWECLSNGYCDGGFGDGDRMHVDMHSCAFAPGPGGRMFIGCDGGVYSSDDGGATLESRNQTLSLVTFRSLVIHPSNPAMSFGGTQDNGTQRRDGGGQVWQEIITGDGNGIVFNPRDPSVFFTTYVYGYVFRWYDEGRKFGGTVATNATFGEPSSGARIAFYPPFVGNGTTSRLYFGTWRLFVSDNLGDGWSSTSGMLDLTKGGYDTLSAIGVAPSTPGVIYTGSAQGRVMVSRDAGATWRDVTAGLPDRFVTWIAVDRANPSVAWVSVSGFRSGHIFRTTSMGESWTDVSGLLPDIPANAVMQDPIDAGTIYLATDIGVFRSTSNGLGWESLRAGMPATLAIALASHPSGIVQVGTYGRGAYELGPAVAPEPGYELSAPSAVSVARGAKVRIEVGIVRTGGFGEAVTVTSAAEPALKAKLKPATLATGGDSVTFNLKARRNAAAGTFRLVLTSRIASGVLRTANVDVTVR